MVVKSVLIFKNGMAMVFDEKGKQIPRLQGPIFEVIEKIAQDADENTEFEMQGGKMNVSWWFATRKKDPTAQPVVEF